MNNNNNIVMLLFFLFVVAFGDEVVTPNSVLREMECPNRSPKWKYLGGDNCYILELNEELPWIDAVYKCFIEGGSLASFHSAEDLQMVLDEARDHGVGDVGLLIGLRKNKDGSFQWVDKTPVDFPRWQPRESNTAYETCFEINVASGQWNDIRCSRRSRYVCSAPKNQVPPTIERKQCPDSSPDWEDFGGDACYIVEIANKVTWPDALRHCNEKGGSLASFHSIEEISVVMHHAKSYYEAFHIGLKVADTDGLFRWTDDSAIDLDYWRTDVYPYSLNGAATNGERRTCGQMMAITGEWSDEMCKKLSGYICSTPKEISCGGDVVGKTGILKSPNYPENYGRNEYCVWTITGAQNRRIYLNFFDFNLQYSDECDKDYVEIRDGHGLTSPVLDKICGNSIPDTIASTGNKMKVIFRSNGRRESTGFLAEFEGDICSSDIVADGGSFTSPNFPDNYPHNENCTWKITVPRDHTIVLVFYKLEVEPSLDCKFDRVEIRDGHDPDSKVLGTFCGRTAPTGIFSSTNKLLVNFVTDGFIEMSGFSIAFHKIA